MKITVVTKSWSDTKRYEELLSFALSESGKTASIAFVMGDRTPEACITSPPALIIDGRVEYEEHIPELKEIIQILKTR